VPLLGGGAGFSSNSVASAEVYLPTKWHLDPFSHLATIHGPKSGGCCPAPLFRRGEYGSPSNSISWAEAYLRTKWHLDPSAVWPQQTWAKNRGGCAPLGRSWVPI